MAPAASRQDALLALASALARVEDPALRQTAEQALAQLMSSSSAPLGPALLSAAFHDLKEPLAAVMMNASALAKSTQFTDEQHRDRRRIDAIVRCAQRAHSLLGDVHDLLRLEQGRLPLNPGPSSFDAFTQSLAQRVQGALTERASTLVFKLNEPPQPLSFDSVQLLTALCHLISNAVRSAPRETQLTLQLGAEGARVRGRLEVLGLAAGDPQRFELLGAALAEKLLAAQGGGLVREAGIITFHWSAAWA